MFVDSVPRQFYVHQSVCTTSVAYTMPNTLLTLVILVMAAPLSGAVHADGDDDVDDNNLGNGAIHLENEHILADRPGETINNIGAGKESGVVENSGKAFVDKSSDGTVTVCAQ